MKNRTLYMVLVLVGLALLFAYAKNRRNSNAVLREANASFHQGSYEQAIVYYRQALQNDPDNALIMRQLALACLRAGRPMLGYYWLEQTLGKAPDDKVARLLYGRLSLLAGHIQRAWQQAQLLVKQSPGDLDALQLLADSAQTEDQIELACTALETALTEYDPNATLLAELGLLYMRRGEWLKAELALDESRQLNPHGTTAPMALADLLRYTERSDEALALYQQVLARLEPTDALRLHTADIFMELGQWQAAQALLQQFLQAEPESLLAQRRLAQVALGRRQPRLALQITKAILVQHPDEAMIHLLRSHAYQQLADPQAAIAALQDAVVAAPELAELRVELAELHLLYGETAAARPRLEQALELDPEMPAALVLLARLEADSGRPAQAVTMLHNLLEKQPHNLPAHLLLARIHVSERQFEAARATLDQYCALVPDDPRGPYLLAIVALAQQQRQTAIEHLHAALRLAPTFYDALTRLVQLLLEDNQLQAAEVLLAQARQQDVTAPEPLFLQGLLLQAQADPSRAEACYKQALELQPTYQEARLALAGLYLETDQLDAAASYIHHALVATPEDMALQLLQATVLERRGDYWGAQRVCDLILRIQPENGRAIALLARLYCFNIPDPGKAYALAVKAHQLLPHDPRVAHVLGWVLFQRGQFEQALPLVHLQTALTQLAEQLRANPSDYDALLFAGLLYQANNMAEQAEVVFQTVLVQQPHNQLAARKWAALLVERAAASAQPQRLLRLQGEAMAQVRPGIALALAKALLEMRQPDAACQFLEPLCTAQPEAAEPPLRLAEALLALAQPRQAQDWLRQARRLELSPEQRQRLETLWQALPPP